MNNKITIYLKCKIKKTNFVSVNVYTFIDLVYVNYYKITDVCFFCHYVLYQL